MNQSTQKVPISAVPSCRFMWARLLCQNTQFTAYMETKQFVSRIQ